MEKKVCRHRKNVLLWWYPPAWCTNQLYSLLSHVTLSERTNVRTIGVVYGAVDLVAECGLRLTGTNIAGKQQQQQQHNIESRVWRLVTLYCGQEEVSYRAKKRNTQGH